jgi:hypothetical protein
MAPPKWNERYCPFWIFFPAASPPQKKQGNYCLVAEA